MKSTFVIRHSAFVILAALLASPLFAQTSGQSVIPKKNAGNGYTNEAATIGNSQLIGRTAAGTLSGLTLGSGLTLTGSTISASGSGSVATDSIFDAAGDLIQGTGENTSARVALGTSGQLLRVKSDLTGVEWATISGTGSVTSVAISGSDGIDIDSGSPITTSGTIALGINASTLKTHLSLANVENTALSTWAGTANITTLGTITTGTWTGTAIGTSYLASGATLDTEWDTAAEINAATTDADFLTAVTSATITDGTIVNADISASAAIALSKLATDPLARANHTGTQAWSTITTTPTTLTGYGITDAQPLNSRLTTIGSLTPGAEEKAVILESDGTITTIAYTYGGLGAADSGLIPQIGAWGNLYLGGSTSGDIGLEAFTLDQNAISGQVVNGAASAGVGVFGYSVDATADGVGVRAGHSSASGVAFDAGPTNGVGAALRVYGDGTTTLGGGTSASELRFLEPSASGSNYFGFKSQAMSADAVFTLPAADGSSGQVLKTNGSKVLSFGDVAIANVSGLGTGVATAIGVNVGSAGSVVVNGGALGTPSSGNIASTTADDTAYDATSWNGSTAPPTKNAVRDKLETMTGTGSVTSVAISGSDGIDIDSGSPITTSGTIALGINPSTLRTHLSLANVENTAISTWAGTTNITTVGTITTGTWTGAAIGTSYLASGATLDTEWDTLAEVETAMGSINIIAATEIDTLSEINAIIGDGDILPTSGGTLSGNITLGENTSIALDPAGSADGKYSGTTVTGTAGAALAFGDVVVLDVTDSRWELADANAAAAADGDARALLGICVLAAAADGDPTTILLHGIVRADTAFPALTVGAPVYVGETAGDAVVTQPTTADVLIRVIGHALTADELFFSPDNTWITHL
jgi:hypothetical protein